MESTGLKPLYPTTKTIASEHQTPQEKETVMARVKKKVTAKKTTTTKRKRSGIAEKVAKQLSKPGPKKKGPIKKKTVSKKKATTKPRKAVAKKTRKGVGDFGRRSNDTIDKVGGQLLECDTVASMVKLAKRFPEINTERLMAAKKDASNGTQMGLIRMRIGNLIRGAIARADR